jgi:hypothetical protein
MGPTLTQVGCASIPQTALPVLADLRRDPDIRVILAEDRAWIRWEADAEPILRRVLPVPGVELFVFREGHWYRYGCHLPVFGLPLEPDDDAIPLSRALIPRPIVAATLGDSAITPVSLSLARDDRVRPTTAMTCAPEELKSWAETATTAQLTAVSAAWADDLMLLRGQALPALSGCTRFWGARVLVPLGFRPDPDLPESAVRRALRLADDVILLMQPEGFEEIPSEAFAPLTRAGVRRALGVHSP